MTVAEVKPTSGGTHEITLRTLRTVQLLLGGVILFSVGTVATIGAYDHGALLILGLATAAGATAVALLAQWQNLPTYAAAIVPALDMLAIGLLRQGSPTAGFALLWAFPAMWSAWSFGMAGSIASVGVISVAYWLLNAFSAQPLNVNLALIFPAMIAVLAGVTQVIARRVRAQRALLERQSLALRRAAARAHRQEILVTDVLDSVDFGVVAFDANGTVTIANEAHDRLQEVRDGAGNAVYADDGFTAIPLSDRPSVRAQRGEAFEAELVWYGEPGSPQRRALQVTARPLRGPAGEDAGRVFVARDVTSEQLALRAREDLIASVSHELRTPLTSILGYLELAEDDPQLSEETRKSLAIAERNAERLLELVTDVLATSAISRMGIDFRVAPEPVELSEIVASAVESAQLRARDRGMTIDSSAVEHCPARADAHRIRQVVDNLIGNAIKYGREGGHIAVGCTIADHHAWIVVRDDGAGITEHDLPKIFDRFFRSESVRHTGTHGSGLGLSISREIVRAHGGDITVTSTPGSGATFMVRLPTAPAEEAR